MWRNKFHSASCSNKPFQIKSALPPSKLKFAPNQNDSNGLQSISETLLNLEEQLIEEQKLVPREPCYPLYASERG